MVTSFKYLGQVISAAEDYWLAVVRNLSKVRLVWWRLTRILSKEGAAPRVPGFFFKAVVLLMLLFSAETWVAAPLMGWFLGWVPVPGVAMVDKEAPKETDR